MKKLFCIIIICFINGTFYAQSRNDNWCFGDSSGINFMNQTNPQTFTSSLRTRGSCAVMSDSIGTILFYAATRDGINVPTGLIFNKEGNVMQNGDSINGEGWYQELIIIPHSINANIYYLFSISVVINSQFGLYYSTIDMSLDSNRGAVVQKNIQLRNEAARDGINAIKHANGRDWWLIFRNWEFPYNNIYYQYLISPTGVNLYNIQSVGAINQSGGSFIQFSNDGTKILEVNWKGLIQILNFDRCTGIITLDRIIEQEAATDYPYYVGCEFSEDSRFVYITSNNLYTAGDSSSYLYQYDLNESNPSATRDTLYEFIVPEFPQTLKRAPDDKIYLSSAYENFSIGFPYQNGFYNYINQNLSVINTPDSLGAACNFTPFSFYLGGTRTYYGLPNNPNYDLGPIAGSTCDSLHLSIKPALLKTNGVHISPNPFYNKISFHPLTATNENVIVSVYNYLGKLLYTKQTTLTDQEIDLSTLSKGVYLITVVNEKNNWSTKIVKL